MPERRVQHQMQNQTSSLIVGQIRHVLGIEFEGSTIGLRRLHVGWLVRQMQGQHRKKWIPQTHPSPSTGQTFTRNL